MSLSLRYAGGSGNRLFPVDSPGLRLDKIGKGADRCQPVGLAQFVGVYPHSELLLKRDKQFKHGCGVQGQAAADQRSACLQVLLCAPARYGHYPLYNALKGRMAHIQSAGSRPMTRVRPVP